MAWFVTGITDPTKTTGTVIASYIQAASIAAATKIIGGAPLAGPFSSKTDAQKWVTAHPNNFGPGKTGAKPIDTPVTAGIPGLTGKDWLGGIGGAIASAIEGGVVVLLKDVWKTVGGAVEILVGVLIIIITLGLAFRNDVAGVAAMAL